MDRAAVRGARNPPYHSTGGARSPARATLTWYPLTSSASSRRYLECGILAPRLCPRLLRRVLWVPKRLRYFLHRDAALQGAVLRVFLHAVEQCLRAHSRGAGTSAHLGAVAFIHRFTPSSIPTSIFTV